MKKDTIEEKRKKLNLELRKLLALLAVIDGTTKEYPKYEENSLEESEYLAQQIKLIIEAKERLVNVFKN